MERVAAQAGVSKATLYRRYPHREALLEAVVAGRARHIHRALDRSTTSPAEVRVQLERFVADLCAFVCGAEHQRYVQALVQLTQVTSDLALIWRRGPGQTHTTLADYLRAAAMAGHLECSEPEHAADLLIGMAVGMDLLRLLYRVPTVAGRRATRRAHAARVVACFARWLATAERNRERRSADGSGSQTRPRSRRAASGRSRS
jgi:TetR/AcrR family transcriptional repressor of mexJK operon